MGIVQGGSLDRRFFARIGASRLERAICGGAGGAGVASVNGNTSGMLPQDLEQSRYIILWGANPIVTNLHVWPLIRKARENGRHRRCHRSRAHALRRRGRLAPRSRGPAPMPRWRWA